MIIVNLTQHKASIDQIEAGVVDLPEWRREELIEALTFRALPDQEELETRADFVSELVFQSGLGSDEFDDPIPFSAMIGGASFFMSHLERALKRKFVQPLHAFTERKVVEFVNPDGSITKESVFRHMGFVPA